MTEMTEMTERFGISTPEKNILKFPAKYAFKHVLSYVYDFLILMN